MQKETSNRFFHTMIIVALAALILLMSQVFGAPSAGAEAPQQAGGPTYGPDFGDGIPIDQIIIKFVESTDPATMSLAAQQQLEQQLSAAAGVQMQLVRPMSGDAYVYRIPEKTAPAEVGAISNKLQALPNVIYAEPDAIMQTQGEPMQDGPEPNAPDLTPNDPLFGEQWHYRLALSDPDHIEEGANLIPAWNITTGNPNTIIAVVDTGALPYHPDSVRKICGRIRFYFQPRDGQ